MSDRPKTTADPALSGLSHERRAQLDELARRTSDSLPAERPAGSSGAQGAPMAAADERDTVFSLFGGASRNGVWEPPAELSVFTAFGGVELDFREADMLEGLTEVKIVSLFGGVSITVPPDIDVETKGLGIFGGFSHHTQRADEDDAPRLRVTGVSIFGGVGVKTKARKRRWRLGRGRER